MVSFFNKDIKTHFSRVSCVGWGGRVELAFEYRGTSLIRNRPTQDPTVGLCLVPWGGPRGWGLFLMSEVPL